MMWRSLVGTSMALVGLVAGLAAEPAAAETLQLSGKVAVGFGQVHLQSEKDTTAVDGFGEAKLAASGAAGPLEARVEITLAGGEAPFNFAQHQLKWTALEGFSVIISGSSFGIAGVDAGTDGNIAVVNAPDGPLGNEKVFFDYSKAGLINVEYRARGIVFGLAVADTCVPECGYGLASTEPASLVAERERVTTVAHLRRPEGALLWNLYLASSGGQFANGQSGKGSGVGFGLLFDGGVFTLGLDASSATVACSAKAGDIACADDLRQTRYGIAVRAYGAGIHYVAGQDKTGVDTKETANIDAVYLFDVGPGTVGPEYRTVAVTDADGEKTTDSVLLFGMSLGF